MYVAPPDALSLVMTKSINIKGDDKCAPGSTLVDNAPGGTLAYCAPGVMRSTPPRAITANVYRTPNSSWGCLRHVLLSCAQ